ncbi:MAG: peptidylprolyl isomerase [Cyclobacteriaceae bacterium]|nr:peptidylprolyl isomerase [Cyclobacteriaceae bacterium]MDH4295459.1 peptidylprolyl isomerase [Cyclobacteriaceae bacterium]MDH5249521.1 peptidylprolyl isomerase [Cyclobacteriaceae bacterium]
MNRLLAVGLFLIAASCGHSKKEAKTYPVGQIITSKGEMLFWLYDETPLHKASFIKLANGHYWDSLTFNRVIRNFVIQGGCPDTPEGFSDSPYLLWPEFNDSLKHVYGAVGAGRDDNPEKLSAGCQFYIVHNKEGIPRLDGNYVIFGQVFKGLEVLEAIATVTTDSLDAPLTAIPLDVNIVLLTAAELEEYGYAW